MAEIAVLLCNCTTSGYTIQGTNTCTEFPIVGQKRKTITNIRTECAAVLGRDRSNAMLQTSKSK